MGSRKTKKQRRAERAAKKQRKAERKLAAHELAKMGALSHLNPTPVDVTALAPDGSYSIPEFVDRGFYLDVPFTCQQCGKDEVWLAVQQKWWYEVAKGGVWTRARLCRPCRQNERRRRDAAREAHLDGIALKESRTENLGH